MDNRAVFALIVALALPACGSHTVDLDSRVVVEPSSDPGMVAIVHERVQKLAVDDERLYWIGTNPAVNGVGSGWSLHSCQKRDCATTLVTYASELYSTYEDFAVRGGQIYWEHLEALVACPIAGCVGLPRTVVDALQIWVAAFDDDRIYTFDQSWSDFASLPLVQPGPLRAVAPAHGVTAVALHDVYAYWLTSKGADMQLLRARKDGSSAVEGIADTVRFTQSYDFSFATDSTSIYWTSNALVGSITRCPLSGCTGTTAETVLGPLRAPQKLLIDGSTLYYVYEAGYYQYALARCTLPACQSPEPVVDHLSASGALAVDDQSLYVAMTGGDTNPQHFIEDPVTGIRRMPKPDQGMP